MGITPAWHPPQLRAPWEVHMSKCAMSVRDALLASQLWKRLRQVRGLLQGHRAYHSVVTAECGSTHHCTNKRNTVSITDTEYFSSNLIQVIDPPEKYSYAQTCRFSWQTSLRQFIPELHAWISWWSRIPTLLLCDLGQLP